MVRYISVITDYEYLLWQQELQVFNFKLLEILDQLTVVVLRDSGVPLSEHAKKLADLVDVHYFVNDQPDRSYIPSNKPWGLMKLLEKHPEYGEEVFLLDSDVIFKERLNFNNINRRKNDKTWYVSNCVGYLGYSYLVDQLGEKLVDQMAQVVGLTGERLKKEQLNSGGAQYYMKNVTADFCKQVALDSINIYNWSIQHKKPDGSYKIQVWTAEMWSWLWNAFKVADVKVSYEMRFSWAPHDIEEWYSCKMLHLAGVVGEEKNNFYKGKYANKAPWEVETNFHHVDRSKCWGPYVELIEAYKSLPTKRGVVCYLDGTPEAVESAKKLFKSILDSGHQDTDLVLFGSIKALSNMANHPRLAKIVTNPEPGSEVAPELNSYACFKNDHGVLYKYTHLLKTNVSTVIKQNWKDFLPDRLVTGPKSFPDYTFYGPTSQVLEVCQAGLRHAKRVLYDMEHRAPFYSVYTEIVNRIHWFEERLEEKDLPWIT
jgi:hypothetical protein